MRSTTRDQRGSILVVVLFANVLIAGLAYGFLVTVGSETRSQQGRTEQAKALYIAESGIADAVANLVPVLVPGAPGRLGSPGAPVGFGGGGYVVDATAEADRTYTVLATASYGRASVTVETRWGREFHPVRDFAIFQGNRSNLVADPRLELGGTASTRDIVNGKIYVTGSLHVGGGSEVHGDASATGTITGNPIDGGARPSAPRIQAPDLRAMRYDEIADFRINATTPFNALGRLPATDPRHIFVKNFRTDLAATTGFRFDNTNYFLGDPYESSDISRISVSAAGNEKIYFVDGNLWIEPQGPTSRIVRTPPDGTRITVVVRGNIYFCDDLLYQNPALDAMLFIALTDGESYNDVNGNNQYDAGETILHDDGDGVYEGPREGSGNIHFGDPNGGGLGHVQGFMYADNYFKDHVLNGTSRSPLPFQVTGFMSAGEEVRIRRQFGTQHAQMKVNFDPRVVNGGIVLPGFPEREEAGAIGLLSWRLLGAAD